MIDAQQFQIYPETSEDIREKREDPMSYNLVQNITEQNIILYTLPCLSRSLKV